MLTRLLEWVIWLFRESQKKTTIDELVDFIIENKWLPVLKARDKFGRTGEKCKAIGDRLEERGILRRGRDNARVLIEEDPQVIEFGLNYEQSPTPLIW